MPKVINDGAEDVPISLLKPHPDNPNEGDFGAIQESVETNGFFGRLIANRPTKHILIGNHRYQVAKHLGFETLPVEWVNVDAETELRILLADNRTARLGRDNDAKLAELLADLANTEIGLTGLGYDGDDLDRLIQDLANPLQQGAEGEVSSPTQEAARKTLAERFGVPPFSVLDARQGYWQERKRAWLALGLQSELGRGDNALGLSSECEEYRDGSGDYSKSGAVVSNGPGGLVQRRASARGYNAAPGGSLRPATSLGEDGRSQRGDGKGHPIPGGGTGKNSGYMFKTSEGYRPLKEIQENGSKYGVAFGPEGNVSEQSGTSIFDPVLCELAYRWFCPDGGAVLDPFAGGSVRGVVAALLGRQYTGIDLRAEQIEANEQQAAEICPNASPRWITGDSRNAATLAPGQYDLIFSCPPYADLEVYSDNPQDLSTLDYAEFLSAYRQIIAAAVGMLKENRFACFVVGDVRDKKGFYRNFVSDTIDAFQDAGATLYNEAILVTAVGSLPIRVGKQFGRYRKLGKTHQNVLAFWKGDPQRIPDVLGEVDFTEDPAEEFGEVL